MTIHIYHQINRNPNTLSYYEDDLKNISTSYKPQIYLPKVNFSSFYLFNAVGLKVKYLNTQHYSTSTRQVHFIHILRQVALNLLLLMGVLYVFVQFYAVLDLIFSTIRDYYTLVPPPAEVPLPITSRPIGQTLTMINSLNNEFPRFAFKTGSPYNYLFPSLYNQQYSIHEEVNKVIRSVSNSQKIVLHYNYEAYHRLVKLQKMDHVRQFLEAFFGNLEQGNSNFLDRRFKKFESFRPMFEQQYNFYILNQCYLNRIANLELLMQLDLRTVKDIMLDLHSLKYKGIVSPPALGDLPIYIKELSSDCLPRPPQVHYFSSLIEATPECVMKADPVVDDSNAWVQIEEDVWIKIKE